MYFFWWNLVWLDFCIKDSGHYCEICCNALGSFISSHQVLSDLIKFYWTLLFRVALTYFHSKDFDSNYLQMNGDLIMQIVQSCRLWPEWPCSNHPALVRLCGGSILYPATLFSPLKLASSVDLLKHFTVVRVHFLTSPSFFSAICVIFVILYIVCNFWLQSTARPNQSCIFPSR